MLPATVLDLSFYLGPLLVVSGLYVGLSGRRQRKNLARREAATRAGLTEPASLHPHIDRSLCIGCAACVAACPERDVLGLIDGKAELVNPTHCIGHGACKEACPMGGIQLVFGTERRGIEIPQVSPEFETNVPGVFIAGEIGGMGLIRNAIEQGRQAMESVARRASAIDGELLDVVIVGAGPAGLSASLAAMELGLRFVTLEQDSLGGTVAHYPRGKIVMTAPAELPLVGTVRFRETTKERLLDFWHEVVQRTGVHINYGEPVETVRTLDGRLKVTSTRADYETKSVLLATGRRGSPRKLNVTGEDRCKVVYRLTEPEQYRHRHVLVVGGGDSALEAAIALADQPGATVTLSYRGQAFTRAKDRNLQLLAAAQASQRVRTLLESDVTEIKDTSVVIMRAGREIEVANDAVVVCAGGVLPTAFLQRIGVAVETKYGTA